MENASKALIIAGAILLSILIIGLGMMVFNNAKNTLTSANLAAEQIDAFNSKFESYDGTNKRGTDVRTLCDTVKSNNATTEDENNVTLKYGSKAYKTQTEIAQLKQQIKNGKRYTVTIKYSDSTKLINVIEIVEEGSKDGSGGSETPTE